MASCEFLIPSHLRPAPMQIMTAMRDAFPYRKISTGRFLNTGDLLMLWGYGALDNAQAIKQQLAFGKHAVSWDYGYTGKKSGYYRLAIDDWHPQPNWIDRTEPDPMRWDRQSIPLRNDYDPNGPIILIGMGPKSHQFLQNYRWEQSQLAQLRKLYPGHRILYRPKPKKIPLHLDCEIAEGGSIEEVMRGASLVVCRHSNVSVDAAIAGVPFTCEDGAALWLAQREFTVDNRLDFLRRLAHWQYKSTEANEAWDFLRRMLGEA